MTAPMSAERHEVVMIMRGHWQLGWEGGRATLAPGDVCAVPPGLARALTPAMTGEASLFRVRNTSDRVLPRGRRGRRKLKDETVTKILTTHVGSLPRSQAVADFIFAREREEDYDQAAFDACMTSAVDETVRRQKECGIDIVSDGETSKISYSTYVKDRYTGFSGDSPRNAPADLKLFPSFLERLAQAGGTPQFARPCCTGEVTPKDGDDLKKDLSNLRGALTKHGVQRAFMNAASPGVISQFLPNQHYPSRGDYLAALAEAMQGEYETIVEAGLDIQLDCPDLALARHVIYSDLSDDDFL